MKPPLLLVTVLLSLGAAPPSDLSWPQWRGPNGDGVVAADPPTVWNESTNVLWKVELPGRGHASPIVVGERVLIATADEPAGTQSLMCFHRDTGKQLWNKVVHQ